MHRSFSLTSRHFDTVKHLLKIVLRTWAKQRLPTAVTDVYNMHISPRSAYLSSASVQVAC